MLIKKCECCRKEFKYWKHQKRKYCSKKCFIKMPKVFSHMYLSKDEIKDLYFKEKLSFGKIFERTGVCVSSIRYWFKKWGFKPRSKSEAQEGQLNHSYKDGIKDNMTRAYLRDGKKCVICNYSRITNVHHIKLKKNGGGNELSNLITLCPNCHSLSHINIIRIINNKKWIDSGKTFKRNSIKNQVRRL